MKKVLALGELMLKLSTPSNLLFRQAQQVEFQFGGSESNVAIALANLGLDTHFISALPTNAIGHAALKYLSNHQVGFDWVKQVEGRIGIYFLERGVAIRGSQVTYDRDHSCFSKLQPTDFDWDVVFEGVHWFHLSGISAAISESAAHTCAAAIEAAKSKGISVSMDLNYRKRLWKYGKLPNQVMPDLVKQVDFLLADPNTANIMLGTSVPVSKRYKAAGELKEAYDQLQTAFPNLKHISMLLREVKSSQCNVVQGVLYHEGQIASCEPITVEPMVERIGGGDAFMSGLIYGILTDQSAENTIEIATSLSALKLTVAGDESPFTLQELSSFMANDKRGSIVR